MCVCVCVCVWGVCVCVCVCVCVSACVVYVFVVYEWAHLAFYSIPNRISGFLGHDIVCRHVEELAGRPFPF